MPSIRAPILASKRQRSCTCGSRAALKISVRPSASTAASRMFSVPVTVGRSKTIRAPRSRSTSATISVALSSIRAPICRRPRRCCSTRRAPMSSPPGRGNRAWPRRPSSAPNRTMVARMRRPSSSGTSVPRACPIRRTSEPSPSVRPPNPVRICAITAVSVTLGTFVRRTGSAVSSAAAISGRAAFLEPLTHSSPASSEPPLMRRAPSRREADPFISRYGTDRRWKLLSAPAQPSQAKPRLRDREGGLELDFLGRREGPRSSQHLLGSAARLLGSLEGDLVGVLRHVRQHRHTFGQHLEEPAANEKELLAATHRLLDAERAGLEQGQQGGVPSQHAELSVGPVGDDELDLALVEASLDANHPQWVFQLTTRPSSSSVHPARAPRR